MTTENTRASTAATLADELRTTMSGEVLTPGDPAYDPSGLFSAAAWRP